jgi:GH25 family lysozyme M1 (1,4-beta-N-acetylmuramidase)
VQYKYSIFPDQPQIPEAKLETTFWAVSYSVKIIDISYHQDPDKINYDDLAKSADGFILRAAYGTGVDGKWQGTDPAFDRHYNELWVKRGKPCGAYHYIVAYKPIPDQVEVMYNAVKGKKLLLGLWCDVELEKGADPLTAQHVIDYMTQAEAKMGKFGIYNGHWCWMDIMGNQEARYSDRKLWMSVYTTSPDNYIPHGWDKWWLWQYTSTARLPGYYGNLDVSYFYGSREDFNKWIGGSVLLNIPPLSQKDPKWSSIKLGTSPVTIGGYGCLITCASMMLKYFGFDTDPAQLNENLIRSGGYNKQNLFIWGSLNSLYPGVRFLNRDKPAILSKIDEQLSLGRPVIVNVDGTPASSVIDEHWVLVIGKEGGYYIINDPIDGRQMRFNDRYGDPQTKIYIVSTYSFTGEIPPVVTPPQEDEVILYKVRVLIKDLVIRSGPGTLYPIVYRYASGEYGILEEKNNYGRIDATRWISLDPRYVEKVSDLDSRVASLEVRVTKLEQK